MRPGLSFVLTIHCLLADLAQCFSITGIPDQVTESQPITFTWFWGPGDPTKVLLARTRLDVPVAGILDNSVSITENVQTQGILTYIFPDVETASMIGYDLDHVSYDSIVRDVHPRPSFFFEDKHQITVVVPGSPPPLTTVTSVTLSSSSFAGGQQLQATQSSKESQSSGAPTSATATTVTRVIFTASGSGSIHKTRFHSRSHVQPATQSESDSTFQSDTDLVSGPRSTESSAGKGTPTTSANNRVSPGLIAGAIVGVLATLLLVGVVWRFLRRKHKSNRIVPFGYANLEPFPLPAAIKVARILPQPRAKHRLIGAIRSNAIALTDGRRERADAQEGGKVNGEISALPVTANNNGTVADRQRLEVPRVGVFHHTDSGWRLAFGRRSQPSEAGSGVLVEMPPSYSSFSEDD